MANTNDDLIDFLISSADQMGVPANLALSLAHAESSLNPNARGPVTRSGERAVGMFQLMPGTAKKLGVNAEDPYENILGGLEYLRQNREKLGSWDLAVAAHHAGPGAVMKAGGIPNTNDGLSRTADYVKKIMAGANEIGGVLHKEPVEPAGRDPFMDNMNDANFFGSVNMQADAAPISTKSGDGDFVRSVKNYLPQLNDMLGGIQTLGGEGLRRAGFDDIGNSLIESGLSRMKSAKSEIVSKPTDELTGAWEKGIGSVITDWLPYQIGQGVGNFVEMGLTAGVGAVAGSAIGGPAAPATAATGFMTGLLTKSLAKKGVLEAAEKIAKDRGEDVARDFVKREAGKLIGTNAGMAAAAIFHGAGETGTRVVDEANALGLPLDQIDLGRFAVSAAGHAALEFIGDKVMMGAFAPLENAAGKGMLGLTKSVSGRVAATGFKEMPVEIGQTGLERFAAGLPLANSDAQNEYINAAGAAMAMGIVPGGAGGAYAHIASQREDARLDAIAHAEQTKQAAQAAIATAPTVDAAVDSFKVANAAGSASIVDQSALLNELTGNSGLDASIATADADAQALQAGIRDIDQHPTTLGERVSESGIPMGTQTGEQQATAHPMLEWLRNTSSDDVTTAVLANPALLQEIRPHVSDRVFQMISEDVAAAQSKTSAPALETATPPVQQAAPVPDVAGVVDVAETIKSLQSELSKAEPFSEQSSTITDKLHTAVHADAQSSLDAGEMPVYRVTDHVSVALHPSAQKEGMIQVTRYTKDGVIGDSQYNSVEEAIRNEGLIDRQRIDSAEAVKMIEQSIAAEADYQKRKSVEPIQPAIQATQQQGSTADGAIQPKPDLPEVTTVVPTFTPAAPPVAKSIKNWSANELQARLDRAASGESPLSAASEKTIREELNSRPSVQQSRKPIGLSIGVSPNAAEAVSVRSGVVYVGDYPAMDYETEADITVPDGATPQQIVAALRKGGAIASSSKVFGLAKAEKSDPLPKVDRKQIDPAKDSLFVAIAKLGGMDTQELLSNGFDQNDITYEVAGRVSKEGAKTGNYTKNTGRLGKKKRMPRMLGFNMPLHRNGGISFDGMLEALKQHGYFPEGATKNDAIEAFSRELGGEQVLTPEAVEAEMEAAQAARDAEIKASDEYDAQSDFEAETAAEIRAINAGYDALLEDEQAFVRGLKKHGASDEEINGYIAEFKRVREGNDAGAETSQSDSGTRSSEESDLHGESLGGKEGQAPEWLSTKRSEFRLEGQTNEQASEQKKEPELTKEQIDRERDGTPFTLEQESQPKPMGVQADLGLWEPARSSYTDPYDNIETRPGSTERQLDTGRAALRSLSSLVGSRGANGSILGNAIYKGFVAIGANQLIGRRAETTLDLAIVAQVYRDPRFETFRVIYLKNGEIVGEGGYTSRLPASVTLPRNLEFQISDSMAAFGADAYYVMHNHPSGEATPSRQDVVLTTRLAETVPGFAGHVVIDHNEFATISADGKVDVIPAPHLNGVDFSSKPEMEHAILGLKINSPDVAANVAKTLQVKDGYAAIVLTKRGGEIQFIADFPTAAIYNNGLQEITAAVRRISRATGSGGHRFLILPDGVSFSKKHWAIIREGIVTDIVSHTGGSLRNAGAPYGGDAIENNSRALKISEYGSTYDVPQSSLFARQITADEKATVTNVADADLPKNVRQTAAFLRVMSRILGKKIQWVSGANFDGMVKDSDTIYLNVDGDTNKVAVFGHEFWHQVEMTHKAVFDAVLKVVDPMFDIKQATRMFNDYYSKNASEAEVSAWLKQNNEQGGNGVTNRDFLIREFLSDTTGNRFTESDFWGDVFAKLEQREGHLKAVTLIRRFVKSLTDALNKLTNVLKMQGFRTDNDLTAEQIGQVKAALSEGMAQYLQDTRYGTKAQAEMRQEQWFGGRMAAAYSQSPFGPESKHRTALGNATEIEVDGVMRPALNSNGKPIHWSKEGVENFWRWFAGSKVTDKLGRPMVVYHGTAYDFDSFAAGRNRTGLNDKYQGDGFHFSADPKIASRYAWADRNMLLRKEDIYPLVDEKFPAPIAKLFHDVVEQGYEKAWDIPDDQIQSLIRQAGEIGVDLNDLLDLAEVVEGSRYHAGRDTEIDPGAVFAAMFGGSSGQLLTDYHINDMVEMGLDDAAPKQNVIPVYLRSENPLVTDSREEARNAESNGHDGLHYSGPDIVGGESEWVAFSPTQIKSATGNNGEFSGKDKDIRYSPQRRFYSQLERTIEQTPDRIFATAPQFKLWLLANAGKFAIKKEEIQWTGITDWLDLQGKGKISKADVLGYLAQNGVQVEEVEKGEGDWAVYDGEQNKYFTSRKEAEDYASSNGINITEDTVFRGTNRVGGYGTKYSNYVLPGATNYRELLLTLPVQSTVPSTHVIRYNELSNEYLATQVSGRNTGQIDARGETAEIAARNLNKTLGKTYRSSHWEESNILAHIRFNDRTDADGAKVLFVEEIQSDYAQDKRKGKDVPAAPFIDKTEAWAGLAIKRVIAYAVENGYAKVAFVNGQQSADRYDLSKQVKEIEYIKRGDRYDIAFTDTNGNGHNPGEFSAEELEDVVGKEIAQKIIDGDGKQYRGHEGRTLSGLDLKVGGEGMIAFYDKIIPQVVSDVLKKVGGGKVESVSIKAPYKNDGQRNERVNLFREKMYAKYGNGIMLKMTPEEIAHLRTLEDGGILLKQPGFTVTDSMKAKVSEGLPLFSRQRAKISDMADKDTVAGTQAPTSAGDESTGSAKQQIRIIPKWAAGEVYLRNADLRSHISLGPNNIFIRDDGRAIIDGNTVSPGDKLYLNSENKFVKEASAEDREKIAESLRYRIDQLVKESEGINRSVAKSSPSQSSGIDSGFDIFSENFRDPDEWKYARYPNARRGYAMDLLGLEAVDAISDKHDPEAIKQYVVDQYLRDKVFKVGGYLHIDDGQQVDGRLANAIYAYRAMGGRIGKSVLDAIGDKSYIKTYDLDPNEGVSIKDASDLSNVTELKPRNKPNEPSASAGSDVNYSTQRTAAPNVIPEETKAQLAQRKAQDKLNRFTVIKDWLKEQGVVLSEQADVYKAEERMHSRFANKVEDFRTKLVEPLIKKIQAAGFSMDDVSLFLHAQHAEERNNQIAKINPKQPDGGSGMTTADANNVLAAAPAELKALANEFRQITEMTKHTLLDSGIVSQDMVDAWEGAYSNYIPLKGGPDEKASKTGTGKGLHVNGKMKRALGHGKREGGEWIVENILADYERAVMLAEKNRVGHHLVKMALEVGRDDLITIGKPEKRAVLRNDSAYEVRKNGAVIGVFNSQEAARVFKTTQGGTGITITKTNDPSVIYSASPMLQDNEANVYINGHAVRVQINDDLLARAYKNLGSEAMPEILKAGRMLNNYLSKAYTGYNPEFILTNIVRDFTTGLINVTGEEGAVFAAKSAGNYLQSFGQMLKYAVTGQESRWIKDYRADGGNTGAAYLSDLERLGKEVQTEYATYKGVIENLKAKDGMGAARAAGRHAFNWSLKWIEHLNQAGENAMRLAIYRTAIESGKTRAEAASLSKNSTVNFNRKGEWGQNVNALYLFFNAGVQGTASLAHAHFKGEHKYQAWALSSAMVGLGYMVAAAFGGGDEDDYDRELSDYDKSRNLVIRAGDSWVKIPVPYGYGFFYNLGRHFADSDRKGEWGKMPWDLASDFVGEFTPFGGVVAGKEADSKQLVFALPTAAQIPGAVAVNRTGMGSSIFPENPFDKSMPDNLKMWRNTKGSLSDDLAQTLTGVGLEVSPETLKHLGRTATGGFGAFIGSVFEAGDLKMKGADLEVKEMPFVRKFVKEGSVSDYRSAFYEARSEASKAADDFARAKKMGDMMSAQRMAKDNAELIALDKYADSLSKMIKAKRDAQDAIKNDERFTVAEKRLKLKVMEAEEKKVYDRYLDIFKKRTDQRRERLDKAA